MSSDPRRGYGWKQLRREWAARIAGGDVYCWRCERPIEPGSRWDLGHLVDHTAGGDWRESMPEHQACNRSAGSRAAAARRSPPRWWTAPPW